MLGQVIRQYRFRHNLSQPEMAAKLSEQGWEIGASRLAKIEVGEKVNWSKEQVLAISKAMGAAPQYIAFWAGLHWIDFEELPQDEIDAVTIVSAMNAMRRELGIDA